MANEKKTSHILFDILNIPDEMIRAMGIPEDTIVLMTMALVQNNQIAQAPPQDEDSDDDERGEELGYIGRMMR